MKHLDAIRLPLLLVLPLLAIGCSSVTTPPSVQTGVSGASAYLFRGVPQVDTPVLQGETGFTVTDDYGGDWRVLAWGNLNVENDAGDAAFASGNGGKVTEIDLLAEWSMENIGWTGTLGVISYSFPNSAALGTAEVYGTVGWSMHEIDYEVTAYYDVDEVKGLYVNGTASHRMYMKDNLDAVASLSLGFADSNQGEAYWGAHSSGPADFTAAVGLEHLVSRQLTVHATVAASAIIDGDFEDALDDQGIDDENLVLLLGASWSF